MKNKKIIILVLFLAVIAVVLACIKKQENNPVVENNNEPIIKEQEEEKLENSDDIYNPDPNINTSDWQVYNNDEFGFEFKYPKNWEIRSNEIDEGHGIKLGEKGKRYSIEGGVENAIIVNIYYKSKNNFSVIEGLKNWKETYNISIQKINISDMPTYYYSGWSEGVKISNVKSKNFEFYMVSNLILEDYAYPEVRVILQKMVETLKFY